MRILPAPGGPALLLLLVACGGHAPAARAPAPTATASDDDDAEAADEADDEREAADDEVADPHMRTTIVSPVDLPPSIEPTGEATPLDPDATERTRSLVMHLGINGGTWARGASPVGPAYVGELAEGDVLTVPLEIAPGPCYTFIAQGIGVDEGELKLVVQLRGFPPMVIGRTVDSVMVLAGNDECWRSPHKERMVGTLSLHARKGSGVAGIRVYAR